MPANCNLAVTTEPDDQSDLSVEVASNGMMENENSNISDQYQSRIIVLE